jgi:hypothetical protein
MESQVSKNRETWGTRQGVMPSFPPHPFLSSRAEDADSPANRHAQSRDLLFIFRGERIKCRAPQPAPQERNNAAPDVSPGSTSLNWGRARLPAVPPTSQDSYPAPRGATPGAPFLSFFARSGYGEPSDPIQVICQRVVVKKNACDDRQVWKTARHGHTAPTPSVPFSRAA